MNSLECSTTFGVPAIPLSSPPPPASSSLWLTPTVASFASSLPAYSYVDVPLYPNESNSSPPSLAQDAGAEHVPDALWADTSILDAINDIRVAGMRERFKGAMGKQKKLLQPRSSYSFYLWYSGCDFRRVSSQWKNLPDSERAFCAKTWREFRKEFPEHFKSSPRKQRISSPPSKPARRPGRKATDIQQKRDPVQQQRQEELLAAGPHRTRRVSQRLYNAPSSTMKGVESTDLSEVSHGLSLLGGGSVLSPEMQEELSAIIESIRH